jgi:hypothetical protein
VIGRGGETSGGAATVDHRMTGQMCLIFDIFCQCIESFSDFSVLTGVRPKIETFPLERAAEALQKLKSGDVTFRLVLTMQ